MEVEAAFVGLRLDRSDVDRFGPFPALADLELDLRSLGQCPGSRAYDICPVDEEVVSALIGSDESVSLYIVKPFDGSACHVAPPGDRTGKEEPQDAVVTRR